MRAISLIVVHCSATREDKSFTEHDLDVCHRRRGFNGVGYHFYIRKNGDIKSTRPLERIGAHARGFNSESIGICYEGGLDSEGHPKDTRTPWQKHSLRVLILTLLRDYPGCRVCGHRDLSPDLNGNGEIEPEEWIKACPCFDAEKCWSEEEVLKSPDFRKPGLSISSRHLPFHRGNYDRHYGRHNKGNALRVNKRDASGKLLGRHPFS